MTPLTAVRAISLTLGVLIAALHWFMPALTRPDLYFAVTVPPGLRHSAAGIAILRRYRGELVAVSLLALAALAACSFGPAPAFTPLLLLGQLAGSFFVFYRARARVRPHGVVAASMREAEPEDRSRTMPGGSLVASGPFLLIAACAGYLRVHWQEIPSRFPVHWGLGGMPDGWATRSLINVYRPLLVMSAALIPLTLLLYGMNHWVRPIRPPGVGGEPESRFQRTTSIAVLAVEYLIALEAAWIALHPLFPDLRVAGTAAMITLLLPLLVVIALVFALARLGQGGSRQSARAQPRQTSTEAVGDRTDDRYWLLGVIYFNRDDPAILIEKRFGVGYTLNFARPMSWSIVLLVLLLPAVLALLRRV